MTQRKVSYEADGYAHGRALDALLDADNAMRSEFGIMRQWFAWFNAQRSLSPVWGPSSPIDGSPRHALSNGMMASVSYPANGGY